jgi:hypothetical protein
MSKTFLFFFFFGRIFEGTKFSTQFLKMSVYFKDKINMSKTEVIIIENSVESFFNSVRPSP